MTTEILPVHDSSAPSHAAEIIQSGGLVILPTDTVYGLAASPWNERAIKRVYDLKGRADEKALPILLADPEDVAQVTGSLPSGFQAISETFWPGPLTLVLPKHPDLPEAVSSLPTVGCRIPDHNYTREVIRACGGALAVTSANLSGQNPAQSLADLPGNLHNAVDLILDGGYASGGVPSTVISFDGDQLIILRDGPVKEADLHRAIHHY